MPWFLISTFTALFWGGAAVVAKLAAIRISPRKMLLTFGVTSAFFYWIVWLLFGSPFPPGNYVFPVISEGSAAVAFIFYYKALEKGPVSIVAPITSSAIVISVLIGFFLFDNPVSKIQFIAICLITSGVILLSIKSFDKVDNTKFSQWVPYSFLAMICWGIWGGFSEISVEIVKPVNINLFFGLISLLVSIVYYVVTGFRKGRKDTLKSFKTFKGISLISLSAVISGVGSLLFYIAVNISYVSLVIPVANLHPLVSVVFDIYNKNYPKVHQWVGIFFILTGLIFIGG